MEQSLLGDVGSPAKRVAAFLSVVGSPYLVTAATGLLAIFARTADTRERWLWSAISIILPSVVPLLYTVVLVRLGKVTDIHVAVREHRSSVFVVAILSTALATMLLWRIQAHSLVVALGAVYVACGVVFAAITTRWKISLHTAVLASSMLVAGRLYGLPGYVVGFLLLATVGWSRVHRGRHTAAQAVASAPVAWLLTELVLALFKV